MSSSSLYIQQICLFQRRVSQSMYFLTVGKHSQSLEPSAFSASATSTLILQQAPCQLQESRPLHHADRRHKDRLGQLTESHGMWTTYYDVDCSVPRQQRHSHLNDMMWRDIKRAQITISQEASQRDVWGQQEDQWINSPSMSQREVNDLKRHCTTQISTFIDRNRDRQIYTTRSKHKTTN